jgi:transposase
MTLAKGPPDMTMVTDQPDAVVGVDTHTDTHTAALLCPVGTVLAQLTVATDPAGYAQLLAWATSQAPGGRLVWAIEGARSHGVGLTRALRQADQMVVQAPQPAGGNRRRTGKSDGPGRGRRRPLGAGHRPPATGTGPAATAPAKRSGSC